MDKWCHVLIRNKIIDTCMLLYRGCTSICLFSASDSRNLLFSVLRLDPI